MLVKNKNVNTFCLIHFYQSIKSYLFFHFIFFATFLPMKKQIPSEDQSFSNHH